MQLINHIYGGLVHKKIHREDGIFTLNIDTTSPLFTNLHSNIEVLLTHGDSVDSIASSFQVIGRSAASGITAAIADHERQIYGTQFHPEVDLTIDGKQMFINFIEQICRTPRDYTLESRKQTAMKEIRSIVKDDNVLVLVSGGVDSSVCAALLHEALDHSKIYALHIDNGFMRMNESLNVSNALKQVGMNLHVVDASETFYNATTTIDNEVTEKLNVTTKPEVKRKIIGDTFMRIADEHTRSLGLDVNHTYLAQGTLRPDLIESASSIASTNAEVIKTHHNDTALVRLLRAKGRIIEPLKDLHKDEVRELGIELGLPEEQVWRQPFPVSTFYSHLFSHLLTFVRIF
jgi:GMP synthase (glutamine-hydrolysing)